MKRLSTAALAALALAAILPTSAIADEPANPVQGAVRKVFNNELKKIGDGPGATRRYYDDFNNTALSIFRGTVAPYSTSIDTDASFRVLTKSGIRQEFAMWHGFLKRKNGGVYSFVISTTGGNIYPIYSLWVNGKRVVDFGTETTAKDVILYPGFNEICLVVSKTKAKDISVSIKKADSLKEPTNIGPGDLWHEDEPDDEDDEDED